MDEALLKKLRCVKCGSTKLAYDKKSKKIKCLNCGKEYDVVEGIPIMLPNEEKTKDYNVKVFDEHTEKYDGWFEGKKGKILYENELKTFKVATKGLASENSLEIGVGTGKFAQPLGVGYGVDPSIQALKKAKERGIEVIQGVAENLPFISEAFDVVYIIVAICFVEDPERTLREAHRVLSEDGKLVIGYIDRDSDWGEFYIRKKEEGHVFYRNVNFYSTNEMLDFLEKTGFFVENIYSTLFQKPSNNPFEEEPRRGKGGGFVVLVARKIEV